MTISTNDLRAYATVNNLGGPITDTYIVNNELHNIFDKVTGEESIIGSVNYRCFYFKNVSDTDHLFSPSLVIGGTGSDEVVYTAGKGIQGTGTEQAISDENTAPIGITFGDNDIALLDLAAGTHVAVWLRRVVSPGASISGELSPSITIQGDAL